MNRTEPLATLKVPIGVRLLVGEIAARTGEPEADVVRRLVVEETVKLLRADSRKPEGEAAA